MEYNHTFFKFMHDLIDSGLWSNLSATARTLYPVLCRFSNESFKEVWPGTDELLRLTGFKTKKSLQQAKKELMDAGLIDIIPGNGRTPSRYYFKFTYPGSKINLEEYRDTIISLRGIKKNPSGGDQSAREGDTNISPNNININIHTNNEKQTVFLENIEALLKQFLSKSQDSDDSIKDKFIQSMLVKYGNLEVGEAIKIAIQRGKTGDVRYLEGILKNRSKPININQAVGHTKDVEILSELEKKFPEAKGHLKYYYFYNEIYYFKTDFILNIPAFENYALEKGYKIKVISSKNESVFQAPYRVNQNF